MKNIMIVCLFVCVVSGCRTIVEESHSRVPPECLVLFKKYGAKEISQERMKAIVDSPYLKDYRCGALGLVEDQEFIMWKVSDSELGDVAREMLDGDHLSVLEKYSK